MYYIRDVFSLFNFPVIAVTDDRQLRATYSEILQFTIYHLNIFNTEWQFALTYNKTQNFFMTMFLH